MNGLRSRLSGSIALVMLLIVASCTPTHNVKPLPEFIRTGIQAGDRVIVTSLSGEVSEFVVTEIRGAKLIGDDIEFDLMDVAAIKVYGWDRPATPCGGDKPVGCSLPFLVSLASEEHSHYQDVFYDACAQHDYCYRHGFASYGLDRETCDTEFLQEMQAICPSASDGVLGKVLQAVDDSVNSRHVCLAIAYDYYTAVRQFGESRFLSTTSTYCAYNGTQSLITSPSSSRASETTPPVEKIQ